LHVIYNMLGISFGRKNMFETADWIWPSDSTQADEYGEFFTEFDSHSNEILKIFLSCDGDYTLFVNGKYAASNQYGDFEHYKIYDEIDITEFTHPGKNTVSILVWHPGLDSSRYKKAAAGLIFELTADGKLVAASGESTPARKSPAYENGRCAVITKQLGYGFHYNANYDDGSFFNGNGFNKAVKVRKDCVFYKRPISKLFLKEEKVPCLVKNNDNGTHYIIDLGEETVGLLRLRFFSDSVQRVRIDWGEDLQNGHVRRIIEARTFSVEYTAKQGQNDYTNYMLRFGARYIELYTKEPITLEYAGLVPQYFPTEERKVKPHAETDKKIYDLCINTLKLCMMEHYVDCPWREQALYAYDSRNQMLAGYYAFADKNASYARSNLKLISMDRRQGGLLSICYPAGTSVAIPSFSLHFITAIYEYYEHTGDLTLLTEVYPKISEIIENFTNKLDHDLVQNCDDPSHWNFYDWSNHLNGDAKGVNTIKCDSIINMLYVIALQKLKLICKAIGEPFKYDGIEHRVKSRIKEVFFNTRDGLFSFSIGGFDYTELANSLAINAKIVDGELKKSICEKMISGCLNESSLSMKCFTYDALLMTDESYREYILGDIRKKYGYMLSSGATATWETINGASDFNNAGSLCHGWSALPIYYYHKFKMLK